ncbi:glycosyltransferase family 39 protein [Duganella sp.]|uniref:glycosyltransferase family 39 protein n=1 Tax=Duganella sp. TaxID=1904440 RepID=UPI0031D17E9A
MLNLRTLIPPDEGRYAEMAREMLFSGDWITTRLNGIKYFEKPPLHAWMSALSFAVFGIGDWQARLWNGVCGIFGVLMVGYTGTRLFGGRSGLYAAMVLASMVFWAGGSQFNSLDLSVAAIMGGALCALLIAQQDDATIWQRRNWMLACWVGMAFSLLAKGLIGIVLPGGVLVLYALFSGDRGVWRRLHIGLGLPLFLLIALPWFLLVAARNPEQPAFFFIHEHWDRFFLKEHHREGPWYYFIVLLLPAAMPWMALAPASLAAARRKLAGRFQPLLLLAIWIVFILAFFSYSSSKLPGYMLPVLPALALLIGRQLDSASRVAALALPVTLGVAGAAVVVAALQLPAVAAVRPLVILAGVVALLGALAGGLLEWRGRRSVALGVLACAVWAMTQLGMAATEPWGREHAGKAMALQLRAALTPSTPVYAVGDYEQSMTFYMAHTVIPVAYTDELAFGLQQEPERGIASLEVFAARWGVRAAQGLPQYAIVKPSAYRELQQRQLPMTQIANDGRRVLVTSPQLAR